MASKFSIVAWAGRNPWQSRIAFSLIGILMTLSFAPFDNYALAPMLLLPLLNAFHRLAPRDAAWIGGSFGAGLFLAGTYWLYISIHVFGQAPRILALLLMLVLVLIMALYYAAVGWLIAKYRGHHWWQFVLLAPAVWVFLEWLRGWVLSGFPWMTIGYSQIDSPLSSVAPVFGVYGVSLVVVISTSALLAAAYQNGNRRVLFLLVATVPWIAGVAMSGFDWTEPSGTPINATIIQGGVSQDRKWLPEQLAPTMSLYKDSLIENSGSDLVVWPEVAIPAVLHQVEAYVTQLEEDLVARKQTLLFGILERDQESNKVFNSVVTIGGLGEKGMQIYRKRHLVPFGEYFPVPNFVREWMRLMNLPYSDISSGKDVQPLLAMVDGTRLSVAICYEDAYGTEQLYAMPEASILINVSNDAWFGDSIAPHQHLQIARMRALEVGRPVIRATNNGISAFIGPGGELFDRGPQFEYVSLSNAVQPRSGLTPYSRFGNWPVILLVSLLMLCFGWRAYLI